MMKLPHGDYSAVVYPRYDRDVIEVHVRDNRSARYFTASATGELVSHEWKDFEPSYPLFALSGPSARGILLAIAAAIRDANMIGDRERELEAALKATEGGKASSEAALKRAFDIIERKLLA